MQADPGVQSGPRIAGAWLRAFAGTLRSSPETQGVGSPWPRRR